MNGFEVVLSTTAEDGLAKFRKQAFHLCLLDVSLTGMNGFELAENIKNIQPEMPVIFLTARGLKVDRIRGLRLQADDYLVKPIDEEELVLRIQSVLRRAYGKDARERPVYTIGKISFEPGNQLLTADSEQRIITEKESSILEFLCKHKENLVNRKLILKEIWGATDQFTARTMDVHLSKIRKCLSALDESVRILNIHGQGFILTEKAKSG